MEINSTLFVFVFLFPHHAAMPRKTTHTVTTCVSTTTVRFLFTPSPHVFPGLSGFLCLAEHSFFWSRSAEQNELLKQRRIFIRGAAEHGAE